MLAWSPKQARWLWMHKYRLVPWYTLNGLIHSPGKERDACSRTISLHIHQAGSPSDKSKVSQARETRKSPEHPNTTAGIAAPAELWGQGSRDLFRSFQQTRLGCRWSWPQPGHRPKTVTPCPNLLLLWLVAPALSQLLLSPRHVRVPTAGVWTQI